MNLNLEIKRRTLAEESTDDMREEVKQHQPGSPEREAIYKQTMEELVKRLDEMGSHRPIWDFLKENQSLFCR